MNVKNILPNAFLMAVVESVRSDGPEKTIRWIETIASKLGEKEGPGLEGDPRGGMNCLYICPFANVLQEFLDLYGEIPPEFTELIKCSDNPAVSNIFCIFHHNFRIKRGELAGKNVYHLASNANAERIAAYNDEAIVRAGVRKEEIDDLLEKVTCIFKFE
jgi:hypothetical protein